MKLFKNTLALSLFPIYQMALLTTDQSDETYNVFRKKNEKKLNASLLSTMQFYFQNTHNAL